MELIRLPIVTVQDVLLARFVGRDEAARMGFPPPALTRLTTAISEVTRNVVQHAGSPGVIHMGRLTDGHRLGLRVIVSDPGKGMENPEQYLNRGEHGGVGTGLPSLRKLVDTTELRSAPGEGTTVTLELWMKEAKS